MSLLRRRPSCGAQSSAQFKPFVLPIKKSPGRDDGEGTLATNAARNRRLLQSGDGLGAIKRLPVLSFFTIPTEERTEKLKQSFKSPCEAHRTDESNRLLRVKTLGMRRRWGTGMKPMVKHDLPPVQLEDVDDNPLADFENQQPNIIVEEPPKPPPGPDDPPPPPPLVLWQSEQDPALQVVVPEIVGKFLRPHQREGVQFMFDCVTRIRGFEGEGCILADDMGLGKTLQSITLMYTLFKTSMSPDNKPICRRAIVVCPTSLVKNWDDEIIKWLHGRVKTVALFEANRDTVIKGIRQFIEGSRPSLSGSLAANAAQVLIISYETFRMHSQRFHDAPFCCDLLICDEAHRLKNANSQINRSLASLACRKRVLLSGTPMQNDLEEFFAMVDFTNPNILGTPSEFRKQYLGPILVGREPDSTEKENETAQACSAMLCEIVNQFILRRGNILNAKHLPPKLMQVVCCPLSPLQEQLYLHFLDSSAFRAMMRKESANVLSSITALKKLCNHPLLIFDESGKSNTKLAGFEGCSPYFASALSSTSISLEAGGYRGRSGHDRTCHPEWSGKFLLLDRLMQSMRKRSNDRIVIVSNYTQTLDVVSSLCRERQLPFVRLDGTTSAKKRKNLVDVFNDPNTNSFAFLLSSKAGGCGLNLIGANRLVLFDPDWNPATDKQAAARVWREGQKKMCFVYRFLATGTLEEKIFQRQLSKEGLQNIVDDKEEVNSLSSKDLKRLFVFNKDTLSDTHDQLKCDRCQWRNPRDAANSKIQDVIEIHDDDNSENLLADGELEDKTIVEESEKHYHPQIGMPPEEDLNSWGHHRGYDSVDDEIMQHAIEGLREDLVSFAFSCRVDWQLLQNFHMGENEEQENEREEERKRKRMEKIAAAKERAAKASNAKSKGSKAKKAPKIEEIDDDDSEEDGSSNASDDFDFDSDESDGDEDIKVAETVKGPPKSPRRSASKEDKWSQKSNDTVANTESENDSDFEFIPKMKSKERVTVSSTPKASSLQKRTVLDPEEPRIDDRLSSGKLTSPNKKPRIATLVDEDEEEDVMIQSNYAGSIPAIVSGAPSSPRPSSASIIDMDMKESEPPTIQDTEYHQDGWSCTRCTLVNPAKNVLCSGCGLRFRRSRLQMSSFSAWDE
jgi:DNA repair and recombination protein RAD54 and RAD54-like protein